MYNLSLYEISQDYQRVFEELMEIPDLPSQVIEDTLSGISGPLEEKGANVAKYFLGLDGQVAAMKEAEAKMAGRRKAIENKSARLRMYLKENMLACQIHKISCPEFELSIRKTAGEVVIENEELLPLDFTEIRETKFIDKTAIRAAIKRNEAVPGAHVQENWALVIR